MEKKLTKGEPAPDFTLESEGGSKSLGDYRGQWVVLYFYPKDDTPGCTAEACDFRDMRAKLNAQVLGVSGDDVSSHAKFSEKYSLNFPLLYDQDHTVAKTYGAYGKKNVYGKETEGVIRSTFMIDPSGTIAEAMYNVKAQGHVALVAERLKELQGAEAFR